MNNFFERIKKKNSYETEYVNIKELFNYLALMNVIIFNKNFESEIEDNIKNKLKYHCYLNKNEFLDENILWFENDFNKKYIKEVKEFLFMINKEENNINFDIGCENNNDNINEEGENLKEDENLNNNKNEENNENDNNNNNKTNIEIPKEERINFKEFLNIVKLKYINKNVKKIEDDNNNNDLELDEDEEIEENEDNINDENELNNTNKLKENSKNILNLNENNINDDNNNNIELKKNNNNLLTLEDENDFTYFDYLFS